MMQSRRMFLAATAASVAALPLQSMAEEREFSPFTVSDKALQNAHEKFYPNGHVAPYPGNTVICHMPAQSRFLEDISAIAEQLHHVSFRDKLGILPPASYHMTVFPGANDPGKAHSSWPKDLPLSASIDACTKLVRSRFEKEKLTTKAPFRVRLDPEKTLQYASRAATLRMVGADAEAEIALRTTRDQLSRVYNHRDPDHDQYGFHITLAYTLRALTVEEQKEYREILSRSMTRILARTPVLELGLPEFCTFPDMSVFSPECFLRAE